MDVLLTFARHQLLLRITSSFERMNATGGIQIEVSSFVCVLDLAVSSLIGRLQVVVLLGKDQDLGNFRLSHHPDDRFTVEQFADLS